MYIIERLFTQKHGDITIYRFIVKLATRYTQERNKNIPLWWKALSQKLVQHKRAIEYSEKDTRKIKSIVT